MTGVAVPVLNRQMRLRLLKECRANCTWSDRSKVRTIPAYASDMRTGIGRHNLQPLTGLCVTDSCVNFCCAARSEHGVEKGSSSGEDIVSRSAVSSLRAESTRRSSPSVREGST